MGVYEADGEVECLQCSELELAWKRERDVGRNRKQRE